MSSPWVRIPPSPLRLRAATHVAARCVSRTLLPTAQPWRGDSKVANVRSRDPQRRNSETPKLRNSSSTERSEVGDACSGTPPRPSAARSGMRVLELLPDGAKRRRAGVLRNSSLTERSDVGEVPSERSSRGGGEVRATGCSPRAAHASRCPRNPSEQVPSVLLAALAVHRPRGGATGRSSGGRTSQRRSRGEEFRRSRLDQLEDRLARRT